MTENPKKDTKSNFMKRLSELLLSIVFVIVLLVIIGFTLYGFFIVFTQGIGGLWTVAMSNPWIGVPWALIITFLLFLLAAR